MSRPTEEFRCPHCPRVVPSSHGLKIHVTRKHGRSVEGHQKEADFQVKQGNSSQTNLKEPIIPGKQGNSSRAILKDTTVSWTQGNSSPTNPAASLANHLGRLRSSIQVVRRIPKGARGVTALALTETITDCISKNSHPAWEKLLLFAPSCLRLPAPQEDQGLNLTSYIKRNVGEFLQGHTPQPREGRRPTTRSMQSGAHRRCKLVQARLADGDIRGAVRILGSEASFSPPTAETISMLKDKHPQAENYEQPWLFDTSVQVPLSVNEATVSSAISSFAAGSSGGLDMLRPQHLKDLIGRSAGDAGLRLLTALTKLCNMMLSGEVPESICPVLYGASLCALSKGHGDIRPIAIGNTLRRLTAKIGCSHISSRIGMDLRPTQLGFGTRGGLEAAAHAMRRYLRYPHATPKVLLKVDYKNAFNTVHRGAILRSATSSIPELGPFLRQCYGKPSHLVYGDHLITSERGIQQGDPLGPVLFCLVTQPLTSDLKSEMNVWYLDDGSLADEVECVLQDFSTLATNSHDYGLDLNALKCELFCTSEDPHLQEAVLGEFQRIAPGIRLFPLDQSTLLGAPLFPPATRACLKSKTNNLKLIQSRLRELPTHCGFFILKNSQAFPKLTHVLRCAETCECKTELSTFDVTLQEALSSILNVELTTDSWRQATWPVSRGGLGIRGLSDLALPAFLASSHSCLEVVEQILPSYVFTSEDTGLSTSLRLWDLASDSPRPSEENRTLQKSWDLPLIQTSIRYAWEQASHPSTKARLLGVAASESGAFLQALPASQLGTLLSDNEFRIATALRLGAPLGQPHVCRCGTSVSTHDPHGLSCRRSAGRITRHTSVNDVLHRAFASAGYPSTLEPASLTSDNNLRPDGVTLIPWREGRTIAWDFTCGDGLAPSHLQFSCEVALHVASRAETNKVAKYAYLGNSHIFQPIAAECLGAFGPTSLQFLKSLGKKISSRSGDPRAYEFLMQRLSLAIQKGNAQAIEGTLPICPTLEIDV